MVELLRESRRRELPPLEQEAPAFEVRPSASATSANRETSPAQAPRLNRELPKVTTESTHQENTVLNDLENVLAQDLGEVFRALSSEQQSKFKAKGEQLARDVQEMVAQNSWRGHKVLQRVTEWLGLIPNVNVYYLRQMAKIKFDALADIYEARQ